MMEIFSTLTGLLVTHVENCCPSNCTFKICAFHSVNFTPSPPLPKKKESIFQHFQTKTKTEKAHYQQTLREILEDVL